MLKLERKDGGLSIAIRDKEKWFSSSLLIGLFIALALHGSAIFLFDIQSFRTHRSRTLPPAMVETDLTLNDELQQIYVQQEEDKKKRRDPLMPIPSTPKLQQTFLPSVKYDEIIKPTLVENSFDSLEKSELLPIDSETMAFPEVFVQLSGGLAGRKMNWTSPAPKIYTEFPTYVHYLAEVQVDEISGLIFWWQPVSIDGEISLQGEAEKVLSTLILSSINAKGISRGLVDITLVKK